MDKEFKTKISKTKLAKAIHKAGSMTNLAKYVTNNNDTGIVVSRKRISYWMNDGKYMSSAASEIIDKYAKYYRIKKNGDEEVLAIKQVKPKIKKIRKEDKIYLAVNFLDGYKLMFFFVNKKTKNVKIFSTITHTFSLGESYSMEEIKRKIKEDYSNSNSPTTY